MATAVSHKERIPLVSLIAWLTVKRLADVFHFFDEFDTPAEQAGWIAALLAGVWVGLGTAVVYLLYRTFPGKTLTEALEEYLGRFLGKGLSLLFAWFFLHQGAITLRSFTDTIAAVILPRTPPVITSALLTFVAVFAIRGGIEVVGRSAIPITIGMFGAYGLIATFIIPELKLHRLLPILGPGPESVLAASIYIASLALHLPLFLMFLGFTKTPKNTGWLLQAQNLFIHGFIALTIMLVATSMSWFVTQDKSFEFLSLVRYVSVGQFIERIDPLLLAGWITTAYSGVAAHLLASVMAMQSVLGLRDYRPLTFPFGVFLVLLCRLLFANVRERSGFMGYGEAGTPYGILFSFILPLILLPIFALRQRALHGQGKGAAGGGGEEEQG